MLNYSILSESISIVLKGNFNPYDFSPVRLAQKGIITLSDIKSEDLLNERKVTFKTDDFEFKCTSTQIELLSYDISTISIICNRILNIFKNISLKKLSAIGINCEEKITFKNVDDYILFSNYFTPRSSFNSIISNPLLVNLNLIELDGKFISDSQRKLFSITGNMSNNGQYPIISISLNNHFPKDSKDLDEILDSRNAYYMISEFKEKLKEVFNNMQ